MHYPPFDIIAACLGILAVLQGFSLLLTVLESAAKRIEARSTWIAKDGSVFEEFAVSELASSQVMQHDFEETRGESVLAAAAGLPAHV